MFTFDKNFVADWASRYKVDDLERELLGPVSRAVNARGYLIGDELTKIGRWKATRSTGYLAKNDEGFVSDVTAVAFAETTPDSIRHRILAILDGVGSPMASAILTVWQTDRFTVLDFRVVEALQRLTQLGLLGFLAPEGRRGALPGYGAYMAVYRLLADRLGVPYRELDQALWAWHKKKMPDTG
jgi:hypothetical protein